MSGNQWLSPLSGTCSPFSGPADDVKATAARNAGFPLVRFSAGSNLTPDLVRQKLIAEYRLARAGPLPEEMG